jgi:hypothetical protein
MTDAERMIAKITATFTETMAKTAEHCAQTLEASNSTLTGAEALRSFASALRYANVKAESRDAPLH